MTTIALPPISNAALVANASWDAGVLALALSGNADLRTKDSLDAIRRCLHDEALRLGVSEIQIDLLALEFMSSSCFKCFVTWLTTIDELEPAKRYAIRFVTSADILWQRRSLHALSAYATDLVKIDVKSS